MTAMRSGLAFDTNLMGRPLTRGLLALWMESSSRSVVVLPTVGQELLHRRRAHTERNARLNDIYDGAWRSLWSAAGALYELVELSADELERCDAIARSFTRRCFPREPDTANLTQLNDALIIAEAVATGTTFLVTNNMRSIDHKEVNGVLSQQWGVNHDVVVTADDALLAAHECGEASRMLLRLFLASTWPSDQPDLTIGECGALLRNHLPRLAEGARMPNVAERLRNAFEVDEDLESVINDARTLARTSVALRHERAWFDHVEQGRHSLGLSAGPSGEDAAVERD